MFTPLGTPTAFQGETLPADVSLKLLVGMMLDRVRAVLDIGNAIYDLHRNVPIRPFPGDKARRP
jgi:hypothetical protein